MQNLLISIITYHIANEKFSKGLVYEKFKIFNRFSNIFLNLNMALLVYFKRASVKKQTKVNNVLPKPDGLLSQVMPMSSKEATNATVCHVMKVPKVKENEEID